MRAKAITLLEAVKRRVNPDSNISVPEIQRQSKRILEAQQSAIVQAVDSATQQLIIHNQNLALENLNRTAELIEATNQHQQKQQQAVQQIANLELQRLQQEREAGQQIALLTTAAIEAQSVAEGAQRAIVTIAVEKAELTTQNTVVYAEASTHITTLNNQISDLQGELSIVKDQLEKAIGEATNWKVGCFEATKHSTEKGKELDKVSLEHASLITKFITLEENCASIQIALNAKSRKSDGRATEINNLQSRIQQLASESNTADSDISSQLLEQSISQVSQLEIKLANQKESANQEIQGLKNDNKAKEELINKSNSSINTLNEEYKMILSLKEKLEALVTEN